MIQLSLRPSQMFLLASGQDQIASGATGAGFLAVFESEVSARASPIALGMAVPGAGLSQRDDRDTGEAESAAEAAAPVFWLEAAAASVSLMPPAPPDTVSDAVADGQTIITPVNLAASDARVLQSTPTTTPPEMAAALPPALDPSEADQAEIHPIAANVAIDTGANIAPRHQQSPVDPTAGPGQGAAVVGQPIAAGQAVLVLPQLIEQGPELPTVQTTAVARTTGLHPAPTMPEMTKQLQAADSAQSMPSPAPMSQPPSGETGRAPNPDASAGRLISAARGRLEIKDGWHVNIKAESATSNAPAEVAAPAFGFDQAKSEPTVKQQYLQQYIGFPELDTSAVPAATRKNPDDPLAELLHTAPDPASGLANRSATVFSPTDQPAAATLPALALAQITATPSAMFAAMAIAPNAKPLGPALVDLVRDAGQGTVELSLAPQELGHLRMSLMQDGEVVRVLLTAERPETIELMRRHADQLVQEFRQAGFLGATLSFGQWGSGGGGAQPVPQAGPPAPEIPETAGLPAPQSPGPQLAQSASGLDLRL